MRAALRVAILTMAVCAILSTAALWIFATAQLVTAWSATKLHRQAEQSIDDATRRMFQPRPLPSRSSPAS